MYFECEKKEVVYARLRVLGRAEQGRVGTHGAWLGRRYMEKTSEPIPDHATDYPVRAGRRSAGQAWPAPLVPDGIRAGRCSAAGECGYSTCDTQRTGHAENSAAPSSLTSTMGATNGWWESRRLNRGHQRAAGAATQGAAWIPAGGHGASGIGTESRVQRGGRSDAMGGCECPRSNQRSHAQTRAGSHAAAL